MEAGPLIQEAVRKNEEWRESMRRFNRNWRIGMLIVLVLVIEGVNYAAGLRMADEMRGKIFSIAFDIVLIGGVIVISLMVNEIWERLSTIRLFLDDTSQGLKK
jgi:hypothetical protein